MASAPIGFIEFAMMAWSNRRHIMAGLDADARVRRIYHYYHYNAGMNNPDWCELITNIEHEYGNCGHLVFQFQGLLKTGISGTDIAYMARELNGILDNDSALLSILKEAAKENYKTSVYDSATRTFRAPKNNKELILSDPAFMLDKFLWHFGPKRDSMSKYRIYVTPASIHCPRVFTTLASRINDANPRTSDFPSSGKMIIPGPKTSSRADKIVLYCSNKEEMQGGIDFLTLYQRRYRGFFENASPRSTRPVEGLTGVAVTPQPTPDPVIMHYAGQTRVRGMSFGMSRAAVIYLAMSDNYRPANLQADDNDNEEDRHGEDCSIQFLRDCHKIARAAKLDIHLDQDALNV